MNQSEEGKGGVLVFLEQTDGAVEGVSFEVLGKARELADKLAKKVTGVLFGLDVMKAAEDCSKRGADLVLVGESPVLKDYTTEPYVTAMLQILKDKDPDIILVGATHNGTSLASSLAIRLHAGLMAHVVDLEVDGETGVLLGAVPGFGGSIVAMCRCRRKPQMATVKPGVFVPLAPDESRVGKVNRTDLNITQDAVKQTVVEKSVSSGPDISRAKSVVVAGLGCGGDLTLAKRLAEALHAELAVSRPLADKGIAPKEMVVGSTGSGLNAELVVVLGVSGASHFASGIRNAKSVVAINSDPNATIFKHSDYCVKADVNKVVPDLISRIEKNRRAGT
jgi:electron transfer flavoprotein alpha subunit